MVAIPKIYKFSHYRSFLKEVYETYRASFDRTPEEILGTIEEHQNRLRERLEKLRDTPSAPAAAPAP